MLALLLQAAAAPVAPAAPAPGSPTSALVRPCAGPSPDGEVVVCGRSADSDRLRPLPARPGEGGPADPLGFRLPGGAHGRVRAFESTLPGATGSGLAVTVGIPLGRRRRADGETR